VQQAISNLMGPQLDKFKSRATYFVAVELKHVMTKYPAGKHSPVIWASEKARRFYFWQRRSKGYPLEYTRRSDPMSQRMHLSWGIRKKPTSATLGSKATYAPYVQSSQYQTAQHEASNWTTDEQAAQKIVADGTLKRIIQANVQRIVEEAFRGLA
jgi:hypothetical protein